MTDDEARLRQEICHWGKSMFDRGLTFGSSGNLSARLADGFLVTPTNSCLGFLEADRLSRLDLHGVHLSGDTPTKEIPLHLAVYRARPQAMGIVHLHSTYATALSCLEDVDPDNAIPPITPYVVMRVGTVPMLPYVPPGSAEIAALVEACAPDHAAFLLANHGPVVSGRSFVKAVFAAEELEETAKLVVVTYGKGTRRLTPDAVRQLTRRPS
jgi:ribulose-5-phosphate 4-epimerase/fuculose-1-phosphate aldolase